ncbi:hypothetical protein CXF68_13240 [Tenacibaculum sp. Bg11-29]|uniref:hypothetical protein n=1 Tax=Tenacibaculum sp. Bg11-29 TaxID=2058306 RepID=UPI000C343CDF|nr:hypothetical protein [Tenacibaculum sp. Bg11-29]PKH51588.1 hypothetical protein CXF68_13240 [Tenacibaculum sp. Bg11-29]
MQVNDIKERKLEISDYGIYILSPKKVVSFFKNKKNKSKKILNYFQKNQETYIESIQEGVWLPILPIDSIEYVIKLNEKFNDNWIELFEIKGFNIEIEEDNDLWIGSLSNLHTWNKKDYDNSKDYNSYETLDDETLYSSFRFNISKGRYLVNVKGFKRKVALEYPEANFGFLFELEKIENFDGYKDPREDEKYNFNVAQM